MHLLTRFKFDPEQARSSLTWDNLLAVLIAFGIIVPVFFQIEGGIFRDHAMIFDPQGRIKKLPIPVSVIASLAGIFILTLRKRKICLPLILVSLYVVFLFLCMLVRGDYSYFSNNIILLVQFMFPVFACILGILYAAIDRDLRILPRVFMFVVCLIIPTQLYCSLLQAQFLEGSSTISPSLQIFSIYQHLQYVPVIFTSGFLVALFTLGNDQRLRKWIVFFIPVITIYVLVASSMSSVVLLLAGVIVWFSLFNRLKFRLGSWIRVSIIVLSSVVLIAGYMYTFRDYNMLKEKLSILHGKNIRITGLSERSVYWRDYGTAITESARSFFLGNVRSGLRGQHPSAHNYYLDFLFHFGFIPFLPFLVFIGMTLYGIYKKRRMIIRSPGPMSITLAVIFLIFFDNMLKVGLRQPYPGIFTFFLWGILISKLFYETHGTYRASAAGESQDT